MKTLEVLTGSAKARLLHELFTGEMKDLMDYMEQYCAHLSLQGEQCREDWRGGLVSFDFWMSLSKETDELSKKHGLSMLRSSKVFSDQLFFSYTALLVTDCIIKYAKRESVDEKFKLTVQVLFI